MRYLSLLEILELHEAIIVLSGGLHGIRDIDVVVDVTNSNLFNLIGIKLDLEDEFHRTVDIVRYHKRMNEFLKKRIDNEAVYV